MRMKNSAGEECVMKVAQLWKVESGTIMDVLSRYRLRSQGVNDGT